MDQWPSKFSESFGLDRYWSIECSSLYFLGQAVSQSLADVLHWLNLDDRTGSVCVCVCVFVHAHVHVCPRGCKSFCLQETTKTRMSRVQEVIRVRQLLSSGARRLPKTLVSHCFSAIGEGG